MAEVDVERLKRARTRLDEAMTSAYGTEDVRHFPTTPPDVDDEDNFVDLVLEQWPAILAALERAERMEKALQNLPVCDRWDLAAWSPCGRCTPCKIRAALEAKPNG